MWFFNMNDGFRNSRILWILIIGFSSYYAATLLLGYCNVAVMNKYKHYTNTSPVHKTKFGSEQKEPPSINPTPTVTTSAVHRIKLGNAQNEATIANKDSKQGPNETKVYRWKGGKFVRITGFCATRQNFNSANLRTAFGVVKMFLHDIKNDVYVSGSIKRSGMWDSGGVSTMVRYLRGDSNMGFLDLGSQLGTYSLVAAKMGRHVVAVDPLVENVLRLCQTVQENNLTDRVTILFTALSDSYRTVSFSRASGNVGGTQIKHTQNSNVNITDDYNANFIRTVRLDDILPFVDFQKAFIKIDVESHEYEALKEGKELFSKIDVRGVLMEWFQIRVRPNGAKLKNFLTNRTFYATEPGRGKVLTSEIKRWPNDILWIKK